MNDITTTTTATTAAPGRPYEALMELRGPFAAHGADLVLLWAEERWEVARVTAPAITPHERAALAGRLAGALNGRAGLVPGGAEPEPDPDPELLR